MKAAKLQAVKETENLFFEENYASDLFQTIFNLNETAIGITDEHGHIIASNPLFASMVIHATTCPDFEFLIQQHRVDENNNYIIFSNGQKLTKLTFRNITERTSTVSYLWIASYYNKKPSGDHTVGVLKNLYKSFIDTSFEMIFRTTPDGKILFMNRLFLRNFGIQNYKKVKGSSIEFFFEEQSHYKTLEDRLLTTKRVKAETINFRKADNTRLTGLVNCHAYQDENGILVFNWTVLDISHQVESENILKLKNEQLAKVNHQMEKFLYSTSHDLRSPLTTILGLTNLVRLETKAPQILDFVSKIECSTYKMDKIIRDIMSLSRTTYQGITSERIDFNLLLRKAINMYHNEHGFEKMNFEIKSSGNSPFYADPDRMSIIFENLVRNAIHFYDVNKTKSFLTINITIDKAHALIEFIDNGVGIGKQHQDDIFNMFYKASH
ncbi:MAG TPA: histidine kinase dimerization/phospho-acceptor domain-containing protein, partial [Cyclobacteriaceae bacterium]|nr:histidine kinase dimerization/phospho-acceptor domain-containing protein [Cyclobacteriaceae bacterium]